MEFSLVKDIFLVIIGAFFTFVFTLLILRLQKKKANITWRKLSNINIPANNLTGINWIIENQGNKSAKNVSIQLKLSGNEKFETIDCQPSENALVFTHNTNVELNKLNINIPVFPNGLSLDISSLVKDLSGNIEISIVGEDIIGKEHKVSDRSEKFKKITNLISIIMVGVYVVSVLGMFTFVAVLLNSRLEYEQTRSIANLYLSNGDKEEAINLYESYSKNSILFKDTPSLLFEVLAIYGQAGDKEKVVSYINKLSEELKKESAIKYIHFLETSSSFDQFRKDKEFIESLEKFKNNNS